jgi:Hint domain
VSGSYISATGGFVFTATAEIAVGGTVATFTDDFPAAGPGFPVGFNLPGYYSASVNWGDGTTSTGTIVFNDGVWDVDATHAYAESGSFAPVVTINDVANNTATVTDTATIAAPAAVTATGGFAITGTEGGPADSGVTLPGAAAFGFVVATFTDANPNVFPNDFSAIIDWGDGGTGNPPDISTNLTILETQTGFAVLAEPHTYSNEGSFQPIVYIDDSAGNPLATATDTAMIVACYCAGTLIAAERGDVPVERLAIGDLVMTASGAWRPIKWIGTRSYGGRFIMGRKDVLPICFKAGSLCDGLPRRDLWISPHHAMYFKNGGWGALIEAKDLVNGVSIAQPEHVDAVEYVHVELDTHDVIIAEGALSETFVDDDSRGMFHNAHEYGALYPDAPREPLRYCAPRLDSGYEVEAIRRRLAGRAGLVPGRTNPGELRAYIDLVGADRIEGWAQNIDYPEAPVCLDIYAAGRLIGQVLANRYRADLKQAGLGSGHHSFSFIPPAGLALNAGTVVVRRSLDGAVLAPSARARRLSLLPAA